jgi:hypothetical protein
MRWPQRNLSGATCPEADPNYSRRKVTGSPHTELNISPQERFPVNYPAKAVVS